MMTILFYETGGVKSLRGESVKMRMSRNRTNSCDSTGIAGAIPASQGCEDVVEGGCVGVVDGGENFAKEFSESPGFSRLLPNNSQMNDKIVEECEPFNSESAMQRNKSFMGCCATTMRSCQQAKRSQWTRRRRRELFGGVGMATLVTVCVVQLMAVQIGHVLGKALKNYFA